jgi:hypothetical protein
MARKAKSSATKGAQCPEFNALLNLCKVLNSLCNSDDIAECEFRSDYVPKIKRVEPVIEPKPKKSDGPPPPRLASIEDQLKELGVEPSKIEKTLDKMREEAEVGEIILRKAGEPVPDYVPKGRLVESPKVIEYRIIEKHEEEGIEFSDDPKLIICGTCKNRRFWRYNRPSLQAGGWQKTDWICDWCHPSLVTSDRTIYKAPEPKPRPKLEPKPVKNEISLEDF